MGSVFLARDLHLERDVAIKVLHATELDEAARERFRTEARALARLQHANVATIHRIGEVGGRPYLSSELVRGQSLDQLPKPLSADRIWSIAIDLTRGLAAAHKSGVLHRDIKPANAVLANDGSAKLIDFGLAELTDRIDQRRPAQAVGTPSFMSPEAWREEQLDARADLYSLGALLYELACGSPPHDGLDEAQIAALASGRDAMPLVWRAPSFPADFAALIDRCLRRDREDRFPSAEVLLSEILAIAPRASIAEIPPGNPYRSLRSFREEHRALFFGRARDAGAIIERLRSEFLVVVAGSSGVGKSSLCHAGVLPAIRDDVLGGGRRWSAVSLVPGRHPLSQLLDAVSVIDDPSREGLDSSEIAADPATLACWLRDRLGRSRGLLLLIDQLEELDTLSDRAEAEAAAQVLARLAGGLPGVRLLMTARSDFLTRLAALPGLGEMLSSAVHLPRPLDASDLREIISGPARVKGFRFESEQMIDSLIEAMGRSDAKLPLLEFALAELWERRREDVSEIPRAALEEIGGLDGALSRHGDETLARLLPLEREAAQRVLLRCVSADRTRARVRSDELFEADLPVISSLVASRLLVARGEDGDTSFELAHEALIDRWETLRGWINADGDRRQIEDRLSRAAKDWERHGRADELVWTKRQLDVLRGLIDPATLRGIEAAFVSRSTLLARRRVAARIALIAALPAILLIGYGALEIDAALEVEAIAADAQAVLDQAEVARVALSQSRSAALAAFDRGDQAAETTWSSVLAESRAVQAEYGRVVNIAERGLAIDGASQVLRGLLASALSAQAELASEEHRLRERDQALQRLASYAPLAARRSAKLSLRVRPEGTKVSLRTYSRDVSGRMLLNDAQEVSSTELEVSPGSHLLEFTHGSVSVKNPILVAAGEELVVDFELPAVVPEGLVYVPAGRFLFGSAEEGSCRESLLSAQPLHSLDTAGYFIARHEVTFAQWIEFLDSLPQAERLARRPRVERERGAVFLEETAPRVWRLSLQPTEKMITAMAGELVNYSGRKLPVDWRKFPVLGVSPEDAVAYLAWLDQSGRLPGARLCDEYEWERAARGADGRNYPHGDRLQPSDANHDRTYGRDPLGYGPDEVGSHPESVSPFGVFDLAGNAWEITKSIAPGDEYVGRGGGWYEDAAAALSANRMHAEPTMRDPVVGFRVCADGLSAQKLVSK